MTEPNALLSAIEARILGCLIEKEATTPEQYPLTLNAIHLACNQKTNREPVMDLSLGEVGHSMRQLDPRGLVRSQHGARAERYEHRVNTVFSLTKQQQALICVLMLRGPQTLGELMTRTERLASFSDLDDVKHTLERLNQRENPLIERIPRASGQREDRYMHLLCGPVDYSQLPAAKTGSSPASNALEERVAQLEERLIAVEQELKILKSN
ncbi:MAG: YceH family protein [Arenimonas sp.]